MSTHGYLSTACHHGRHEECRLVCKFCNAACRCECGHPDEGAAVTAAAALAAMAEAEVDAGIIADWHSEPDSDHYDGMVVRWASDRLRLVDLHREQWERHHFIRTHVGVAYVDACKCARPWPCPDAQAVTTYWTGATP